MKFTIIISLILAVNGSLFTKKVLAQDAPVTAPTGTNLLPDINPQDIEIKGDYRIRFPGLQRQPILGFDPKPRVFQLREDRLPFLETYDEVVASIPLTPLEIPDAPKRSFRKSREQKNGWILGGFGNRLSPEGEIGFIAAEPSNYSINGFFSHLSSSDLGFDVPSSFYNWNGQLNYKNYIKEGLVWKTTFLSSFNKNQQPLRVDSVESSTVNQFGFQTTLEASKTPWDFWNISASYHLLGQSIESRVSGETEHRIQFEVNKHFSLSKPQSGLGYGLDVNASSYQINETTKSYFIANTYLKYGFRSGSVHKMDISISPYFSSDSVKNGLFIYPELNYSYFGLNSSVVKFGLKGQVSNGGRNAYVSTSRFLTSSQALLNNRGYDAYFYWDYDVKAFATLYAGIDASYYTQFGYVNYQTDPDNATIGRHFVNYESVQFARLKVGFSYRFPIPKLSMQTEIWYLTHQLNHTKTPIPYMEQFGVKASALWYVTKNWSLQTDLQFLGGREGLFTSKSFFVANAKTRYSFNRNWAVYLKVVNLTGSRYQYWAHFNELPLFLTGGITLSL